MTQVKINDAALQKAALEGMDEFVKVFIDATLEAIGGQLTAQNMAELNSDPSSVASMKTFTNSSMPSSAAFCRAASFILTCVII